MTLRLDRKQRLVVPESSIEEGIKALLEYDDWRVFRFGWAITESGRIVGEKDSPDLLALRYHALDAFASRQSAEIVWVEAKSLYRKPTTGQRLWHIGERRRGALIWVIGEDFKSNIESFLIFYRGSGLMRRPI